VDKPVNKMFLFCREYIILRLYLLSINVFKTSKNVKGFPEVLVVYCFLAQEITL